MKNILITSGVSALSQRVAKLLPECHLFFADANSVSFLKGEKYRAIPSSDKSAYVHEVLKVCLDLSIDILIPLGVKELMPLAKSKVLFEEYGITLLLPEVEELTHMQTIVNPNRLDYPEVKVHLDTCVESKMKGVFALKPDGQWGLCCAG